MKAIILSILIFIGIECEAQEQFTSLEWNTGVSHIDLDAYFPGCSYLIGSTYITKSNLVLDAQIGLAYGKSHSFIFSFEESAYRIAQNYDWDGWSAYSYRLATVGYRWNLGSKFGRK